MSYPVKVVAGIVLSILLCAGAGLAQDLAQIETEYQAAFQKFQDFDFNGSIAGMTPLIDAMDLMSRDGELPYEVEEYLQKALSIRGLSYFNIADKANAEKDFTRLLTMNPGFRLNPDFTTQLIEGYYEEVRNKIVGTLKVVPNQEDCRIFVNGEEFWDYEYEHGKLVVAGTYLVQVRKAGYATVDNEVQIAAGETRTLEVTLERTTATITVFTSPSEVAVYLDGEHVGVTHGQASSEYAEIARAAGIALEDMSEPFQVPYVEIGPHNITFRKDCYAEAIMPASPPAATDYTVNEPIILGRSVGKLVLNDLPANAEVYIGTEKQPAGKASFDDLCAGTYDVQVNLPSGQFSEMVDVEANLTAKVDVKILPGLLVFETVTPEGEGSLQLSMNSSAWGQIEQGIKRFNWKMISNSEMQQRLPDLNDPLRQLLTGLQTTERPFKLPADKYRLISTLCRDKHCSIAMLPEMTGDGATRGYRLWLFSGTSPHYEVFNFNILSEDDSRRVIGFFNREYGFSKNWLGITAVDTLIEDGPAIIAVQDGSPAALAGITAGSVITAVDSQPIDRYSEVVTRLNEKKSEESMVLEIKQGRDISSVQIEIKSSPKLLTLNDSSISYLTAIASMRLLGEMHADPAIQSLIQFDIGLAFIQLGDWEEAIIQLRGITLGDNPGINQGTVEYYLGKAFEKLGYRTEALEHYRRAAAYEQATLDSNDGPKVARRVTQKLNEMEGTR